MATRARRVALMQAFALALAGAAARAEAQGGTDTSARRVAQPDSMRAIPSRPDSASAPAVRTDSVRAAPFHDGSRGPLVLPALFYTPETGIGGGIGALWVKGSTDGVTRPSTYTLDVLATRNGQFTLGNAGDIWTASNRWHLTYDALLSKYPYRFFGIGEAGVDSGETYTPTMRFLTLTAQRLLLPGIYAGFKVGYDDVDITEVVPGSILSRTTGSDGWKLVTVGLLANRDTRDRLYWPSTGTFVGVSVARASARLGSTHPFNRLTLDARRYFTVTGDHIIATQAWADLTDGLVPFDRLPQIGGSSIARGYLTGRFRDQQAVAFQAEYRSPGFAMFETVPRFTIVAFAAVGNAAPVLRQLAADQTHFAGGIGVRWALALPDRYNLRVDYGFGRSTRAFYITVGEAF